MLETAGGRIRRARGLVPGLCREAKTGYVLNMKQPLLQRVCKSLLIIDYSHVLPSSSFGLLATCQWPVD